MKRTRLETSTKIISIDAIDFVQIYRARDNLSKPWTVNLFIYLTHTTDVDEDGEEYLLAPNESDGACMELYPRDVIDLAILSGGKYLDTTDVNLPFSLFTGKFKQEYTSKEGGHTRYTIINDSSARVALGMSRFKQWMTNRIAKNVKENNALTDMLNTVTIT